MSAVADSSPLIAFATLDLLHLLPQLFDEVFVPEAVVAEATTLKPDGAGASAIRAAISRGTLQRVEVSQVAVAETAPEGLGAGEREAIAVALLRGADYLILDDRRARREAIALGLEVVGTVRVLEIAREGGHLPAVAPLLDALRSRAFACRRA